MKLLISKQYTETHLLNPRRVYINAAHTDIAATFARIRAEQEAAKPAKKVNVTRIRR